MPDELGDGPQTACQEFQFPGQRRTQGQALEGVPGVHHVHIRDGEATLRAPDGAATITPVAVALNQSRLTVHSLTLRTPTLDDVFLELTGGHIEHLEPEEGT